MLITFDCLKCKLFIQLQFGLVVYLPFFCAFFCCKWMNFSVSSKNICCDLFFPMHLTCIAMELLLLFFCCFWSTELLTFFLISLVESINFILFHAIVCVQWRCIKFENGAQKMINCRAIVCEITFFLKLCLFFSCLLVLEVASDRIRRQDDDDDDGAGFCCFFCIFD